MFDYLLECAKILVEPVKDAAIVLGATTAIAKLFYDRSEEAEKALAEEQSARTQRTIK